MKGQSIGEVKKCGAFVKNLITKLNLSNEQAADIAETSVEVVAKIREELEFKE